MYSIPIIARLCQARGSGAETISLSLPGRVYIYISINQSMLGDTNMQYNNACTVLYCIVLYCTTRGIE